MARVTSKLQVTIPKVIAQRYGIEPGAELDWLPAGEAIRVVPRTDQPEAGDRGRRLELFDRSTRRQLARQAERSFAFGTSGRGWEREDLYERGGTR
jgi:bifunctional DNA-binding transcriptional regulator/antitoxin component of YhaV-PrlF toxin-antitoxin module